MTDRHATDGWRVWEEGPFPDKHRPPLLLPQPHHPLSEFPQSLFLRSLTKAAKALTNSKEEAAGRNGMGICPKTLPNGKWRCQAPEMSPRVSRPQFASSLVMQLLLTFALPRHLGLVVHGPPARQLAPLSRMLPWPWHPPVGSSPGLNRAWSRWEVVVPYLWWRGQPALRRGWGWCHGVSYWPSGAGMERRGSRVGWGELRLAVGCVL